MNERLSNSIACVALGLFLTSCANNPQPEEFFWAEWVQPQPSALSDTLSGPHYDVTFSASDVTVRLFGTAAVGPDQGNSFTLEIDVPSGRVVKFRSRIFSARDLNSGKVYETSIDQIVGVIKNATVSVKYNEKKVSESNFLDPLIGETVKERMGLFDRSQYWGTGTSYRPIDIDKTFRATGLFREMRSTDFELEMPDFDIDGAAFALPPIRFAKVVQFPNENTDSHRSE